MTIRPRPRARMRLAASRATRKVPVRFVARMSFHTSIGASSTRDRTLTPWQAMAASTGPSPRSASSNARATSSSRRTSMGRARARTGTVPSSARAVSSRTSSRRPQSARSAPSRASWIATARPMPDPAPVTSAHAPSNRLPSTVRYYRRLTPLRGQREDDALPEEDAVALVLKTDIPEFRLLSRGKVRDIYEAGDRLLIVATDRISAFDHVLGSGIPDKGRVLNLLSAFWFSFLKDVVDSHLVSVDVADFPPAAEKHREILEGRTTLARRATMFPVECVVRGYLTGSGYKDYLATGSTSGTKLPAGLRDADRLPEPIFAPARKADTGHDENISFERMVEMVGGATAEKLRALSLRIYTLGARHAEERGILLADTKFEFGTLDGKILLCDEVLTPDSSRFWPKESYQPGSSPPSFDKQFVRDYLVKIGWDKNPPAPSLPDDVVQGTAERYREAYRALAGKPLPLTP